MSENTSQPGDRQGSRPDMVINYKDLSGNHRLVIPGELVGDPTLLSFIPPNTPARFAALKDAVRRYNEATGRQGGTHGV